jgi:tetratricopeptide (TPR) repeat protein
MTLTIAEALHQAQEAINGGNYGAAVSTCRRLVAQFPSYVAAYQLLGEAYREQGQIAEAEGAFSAALLRHQRHPGAYLGLGLVADDRGTPESALAFSQVAWELAPNQGHLRENLTRLAMRRYGSDGELQYSRAALAQLHVNSSRLSRAVAEYRVALAALPDRVDLQLGLAECLWRLGQDAEARSLCLAVLESYSESAPALVMLADIEQRAGATAQASQLLERLRAADPDGAIGAAMLARNPRADRAFVELPAGSVPGLTAEDVVVTPGPVRIAPAPDFGGFVPRAQEIATPSMEALQPITLEELGGGSPGLPQQAFDDLGIDDAGLQPITLEELGGVPEGYQRPSAADLGIEPSALPTDEPVAGQAVELDLDAIDALNGVEPLGLGGFEDFSGRAETPFAPTGETSLEAQLPQEGTGIGREIAAGLDAGFDQLLAAAPAPPARPAEQILPIVPTTPDASEPADDIAALAAALESDVADAISRAGEPVPPPAPSAAGTTTGFTSMLRSLDQQGLQPFDPRAAATAESPLPSTDDQIVEEAQSGTPSTDEFGRISRGWDTIDEEIAAAVPEGIQHGYTDELRALNEIGLAPFELEEGAPQPTEPYLAFAGEVDLPAPDAPPTQPHAALAELPLVSQPADAGVEDDEELPGDLQPFSFEEFDASRASATPGPFSFGHGTIQSSQTTSIVPSDTDLEALLASEEDDLPALAPARAASLEPPTPLLTADDEAAVLARGEDAGETPGSNLLHLVPELPGDEFAGLAESSVAVTRELENQGLDIDEAVAAPRAPDVPPAVTDLDVPPSLKPGTELFLRARRAKQDLMTDGVIAGDRELDALSTRDLERIEDMIPTRQLEGGSSELDLNHLVSTATVVPGDTDSLRAELASHPHDPELHWWLAEGLREEGDIGAAFSEYRWLIRNAPERHDAVIAALLTCVDREQEPEAAHRLLGDVYRRRGDVTRASTHAALALHSHRRASRVR